VTSGLLLTTRETVWYDTPQWAATSSRVALRERDLKGVFIKIFFVKLTTVCSCFIQKMWAPTKKHLHSGAFWN